MAKRRVLVIDVGGTNVKLLGPGEREPLRIPSGRKMTPRAMIEAIRREGSARRWRFDAISLGIPAPVRQGRVVREPANLGPGWTRFDFARAARVPVRIVNDAAMQALGSWRRGTMLFLGLGTGLGSALVQEGVLVPLELARLPCREGEVEDYVGARALERHGKRRWRKQVARVVEALRAAFAVDEVVLGGGNAKRLGDLPAGCRLGSNALAFVGGERPWKLPPPAARGARAGPAR
jgi:predicted NBD/HSP70 family sugar kinase